MNHIARSTVSLGVEMKEEEGDEESRRGEVFGLMQVEVERGTREEVEQLLLSHK